MTKTKQFYALLALFPFVVAAQQPVTDPPAVQQPASDSSSSQAAQKLTGEELKKLIEGATVRGVNEQYFFRHTYKKDGTLEGGSSRSRRIGEERAWDQGTWRVDGDRLCVHWRSWDNQERCREVERADGGLYRNVGTRHTFTITK